MESKRRHCTKKVQSLKSRQLHIMKFSVKRWICEFEYTQCLSLRNWEMALVPGRANSWASLSWIFIEHLTQSRRTSSLPASSIHHSVGTVSGPKQEFHKSAQLPILSSPHFWLPDADVSVTWGKPEGSFQRWDAPRGEQLMTVTVPLCWRDPDPQAPSLPSLSSLVVASEGWTYKLIFIWHSHPQHHPTKLLTAQARYLKAMRKRQ